MKTHPLPATAVRLLDSFRVTENNPALIGDLTEECSGGRSSVWLWRQVIAAIAFTIAKEIYSHRLLTIRAIIVGEAAVLLGGWAIYKPAVHMMLSIRVHALPGRAFMLFIAMFIFTLGGWIVSRLYRDNPAALVFLFATLQFIVLMVQGRSELLDLFVTSIYQPWFRWYLTFDMAVLLLSPMCVFLGGYLARDRATERG